MCVKAVSDFDLLLKTVDSDRDIVLGQASIVRRKRWFKQLNCDFVSSNLYKEGG